MEFLFNKKRKKKVGILFIYQFAMYLNRFLFLMLLSVAIVKFVEQLAELMFMLLISGTSCLFTRLCLPSAA